MEHGKAGLGRAWCVSGFALLAWLMLLAPARAGERLVADLDGDERADQITFDKDHGQGIRLAISSGRTFWLCADGRPLHFAAADLDSDTDPGSGDAILATSSDAAPAARSIFPDRRVPARTTRATALSESRAPPRL